MANLIAVKPVLIAIKTVKFVLNVKMFVAVLLDILSALKGRRFLTLH
jgi:hypothetical protein